MSEILLDFLDMRATAWQVFRGTCPLLLLGVLVALLPWNRKHLTPGGLKRILRGGAWVFIGLTLFLQGVNQGFLPAGQVLGNFLALTGQGFSLLPVGVVLGFIICAAEPAVSVLAEQVEEATSGAIPHRLILLALCVGVALATGLGMARLLWGWPITAVVLPGYLLIILLSRFCSPLFVSIAYDASTAVTGPLVSSFLLAVALGAAAALPGRDVLLDGFGLVALVAMVPILAVMCTGCFHSLRRRNDGK